jgi:hypothetical protein
LNGTKKRKEKERYKRKADKVIDQRNLEEEE